ncbi:unnamed protein product [Rotaria sp. Silwood1]|nr:unnamed protein product [Rotaria sp. Silwood1]
MRDESYSVMNVDEIMKICQILPNLEQLRFNICSSNALLMFVNEFSKLSNMKVFSVRTCFSNSIPTWLYNHLSELNKYSFWVKHEQGLLVNDDYEYDYYHDYDYDYNRDYDYDYNRDYDYDYDRDYDYDYDRDYDYDHDHNRDYDFDSDDDYHYVHHYSYAYYNRFIDEYDSDGYYDYVDNCYYDRLVTLESYPRLSWKRLNVLSCPLVYKGFSTCTFFLSRESFF